MNSAMNYVMKLEKSSSLVVIVLVITILILIEIVIVIVIVLVDRRVSSTTCFASDNKYAF